jgi:hypothetical protein
MKKLICLSITVMLLFATVAPVMAFEPIDNLIASGKMSNDEVYTVYVDMTNSSQGSVVSTVYQTAYEATTINTFNVTSQPYSGVNGAKDKLSRFFLYLGNNNPDIVMGLKGGTPDETVAGYVYGERKSEVIAAYVNGIVDCLGNPRLWDNGGGGGSSSSTKTTDPDAWAGKYLATTFTLDTNTYSVMSIADTTATETVQPEVKTMDVSPYIKNDRTYVPVRYLAYALGVAEDGVTWDGDIQQVGINTDDASIILTIGSDTMTVNEEPVTMDVAPEITSDRTFLPARWVAEALGATVEWDDTAKQAIIKMPVEKPGD